MWKALHALWAWLCTSRITRKLRRAGAHGRVSFQEVDLEGGLGWLCTIRPSFYANPQASARLNSWCGYGMTMHRALDAALAEVEEQPPVPTESPFYAPKLGGKEFDDE